MLGYSHIRKRNILPLALVKDLTIYKPPSEADFEVLKSTNAPARANAKGKVNSFDKKHVAKQARFPMVTIKLTEEVLKYCNEFFNEFDFLYMIFHMVGAMFIIVITLKIVIPASYAGMLETNITFYLIFFALSLLATNLTKNAFSTGYLNLTDETKVQVFLAVKTFFMIFGLLSYTEGGAAAFLGMDVNGAHQQLVERVNQIGQLKNAEFNI